MFEYVDSVSFNVSYRAILSFDTVYFYAVQGGSNF